MRLFWVVLLLTVPSVFGAVIHGTVYDFELNVLSDTIVEINTSPRQQLVAKDGAYSFSVSAGTYSLKARHEKSGSDVDENISVASEGDYVLDLILLPSFEPDESLIIEEPEIMEEIVKEKPAFQWVLWLLVFIILAFIVYRMSKKPVRVVEKEIIKEVKEVAVAEELQKVMDFIEQQDGRTTQKDIRKSFPYSEAKISLMIDELESKGLVKKVKKGRGNVIIKA